MKPRLQILWLTLAAIGLCAAPFVIVAAPREETMGLVQKIFYFHVPVAWLCFLSAFVCAAGSIAYLWKGSAKGDAYGVAGAELTVLFGLCVLVTGPLWARKSWGVWWQWDVRLTSSLLLWLIFVGYLFARKYGGPGSRRLAAGLAIFGAADVPLIYISVSIWRTIHPKTSVVPSLQPGMRGAFWLSFLSFTLFYIALLGLRVAHELNRARLDELHLLAEEAGISEAA